MSTNSKSARYKLRSEELEKIMSRYEEVGNCMEWQGARSSGGRPVGQIKRHGRWVTINLRSSIARAHGMEVSLQVRTVMTCGNALCMDVAHMRSQSMSEILRRAAERDKSGWQGIARRAKLSAHARQRFGKLTPEAVADIRTKAEPVAAYMARYGICKTTVSEVRSGHTHALELDRSNPFAGLMR